MLEKHVAAGVKYLNENATRKDWYNCIDLNSLDMMKYDCCVIGQLNKQGIINIEMFNEKTLGFLPFLTGDFNSLDKEWRRTILELRDDERKTSTKKEVYWLIKEDDGSKRGQYRSIESARLEAESLCRKQMSGTWIIQEVTIKDVGVVKLIENPIKWSVL